MLSLIRKLGKTSPQASQNGAGVRAPRVLLQQNSVPHYRRGLYTELGSNTEVNFVFIADAETDAPFLRGVDQEWARSLNVQQARTYALALPGRRLLYFQPRAVWECLRGQYDAVIALGSPYSLTTWAMLVAASANRTPVLLWTHGLLKREFRTKWRLRSLLYEASDGLLLYGDRAKSLLSKVGIENTHVVYNSLDTEAQNEALAESLKLGVEEARMEFGLSAAERVMIFTGRLQSVKRLDLIVDALKYFQEKGLNVQALLIGEGEMQDALSRRAISLGVRERLHIVGACHDEKVLARAYRASDVSVIPSGAGLSVMHSLAYGTPVVTHDDPELQFPEVEAVVPGEGGFLFREGDVESLCQTLEEALFPESQKSKLFSACRKVIDERYNPRVHASRMVAAVRSAIDKRRSTNPVD